MWTMRIFERIFFLLYFQEQTHFDKVSHVMSIKEGFAMYVHIISQHRHVVFLSLLLRFNYINGFQLKSYSSLFLHSSHRVFLYRWIIIYHHFIMYARTAIHCHLINFFKKFILISSRFAHFSSCQFVSI